MRRVASVPPSLLALLSLLPATAAANGNVSHQWISKRATERVPAAGSLAALVGDPSLRQALFTGTMFPDWGYTPGATADERDAGEASHWEPVQDAYRRWIVEHYAPPWSDEARLHLAFYLGMTSHGIADQSYDAMFFERSRFYEAKDHSAFDTDTDVLWAGATGPGEVPTAWIPTDPLLELFASIVGKTINPSSLKQKVGLVGFAILAVSTGAGDPAELADAAAAFPWAAEHDEDLTTPGNPPAEAEIARRYWQSNWALLHGDPPPRPVLWTFPADGGAEHATQAASIESWISIVFARALDEQALAAAQVHVVDSMGVEAPIALDLFYGNGSHVLHLKPTSDLLDDEVYVVTVDPGVQTIHGESLAGWSFTFSTGLEGPPPVQGDAFWDLPDAYPSEDASSSGEPDTDTLGTSGDAVTSAGSEGGSTASTAATGAASDATGTTGAEGGAPEGCACCAGAPRPRDVAPLLVLILAGARRRRRMI